MGALCSHNAPRAEIGGRVSPGFEPVRQLFQKNFENGSEAQAQLCVYVGEKCVVDLWGSRNSLKIHGNEGFDGDRLINVFSSGKSLTSIAIAKLVQDGHLTYDTKVSSLWPEFAVNGKQEVTLADVMRHEAGLPGLDASLKREDLLRENVKLNKVGEVIEIQRQRFPAEGRREYHGLTRGWIANEIVRRVEPRGRTIGEFLRDEVSAPLEADAFVGVASHDVARAAPITSFTLRKACAQSLVPRCCKSSQKISVCQLGSALSYYVDRMKLSTSRTSNLPPAIEGKGKTDLSFFNLPEIRQAEIPSCNANCSARGLARIGAAMANGGKLEGVEILKQETWQLMHQEPTEGFMSGFNLYFTQGGLNLRKLPPHPTAEDRKWVEDLEGFYGWCGFGGSIFQWHPEKKVSIAYIPTDLNWVDFMLEKANTLQKEVMKCLNSGAFVNA